MIRFQHSAHISTLKRKWQDLLALVKCITKNLITPIQIVMIIFIGKWCQVLGQRGACLFIKYYCSLISRLSFGLYLYSTCFHSSAHLVLQMIIQTFKQTGFNLLLIASCQFDLQIELEYNFFFRRRNHASGQVKTRVYTSDFVLTN